MKTPTNYCKQQTKRVVYQLSKGQPTERKEMNEYEICLSDDSKAWELWYDGKMYGSISVEEAEDEEEAADVFFYNGILKEVEELIEEEEAREREQYERDVLASYWQGVGRI